LPPPESLDGIPEVEIGEVVRTTVDPDSIIDLVFVGTGGTVRVVAAGDDDTFDPVMTVFDESLVVVDSSTGDPDERRAELDIDTIEGVRYVVSVAAADGATGDVRVLVSEA
jgi:hypothetical protein